MINANHHFLQQTLIELVKINSINPDLTAEGVGETEIAAYLQRILPELGLETTLYPLAPNRFNVVGIRRGKGGGKSLMWNAHLDTVGANGMTDPFKAELKNGKIYGRGSQDMKGGLAAMIAAAKALQDANVQLNGDLILAAVADEEYFSLGTEDLVKRHTADAAIITEPTELRLCLAHRGYILYQVETFGRAAHGSRYQEGIDAIAHMGYFLYEMDQLGNDLIQRDPHPLVGPPSLHASLIQGGSESSTYPAKCSLELERRTCPGEDYEQIHQEFRDIITRLETQVPQFRATITPGLARPAYEVSPESLIVASVSRAIETRLKHPPAISGASFWTDAALLSAAGIPSVVIGPTGEGLHSAEEWVDLQSCQELADILLFTALDFCA